MRLNCAKNLPIQTFFKPSAIRLVLCRSLNNMSLSPDRVEYNRLTLRPQATA